MHSELLETNVHATVVHPGGVYTDIFKNSGMPEVRVEDHADGKGTSAQDAARMIIEGMERDAYCILVGRDAKMIDFIHRLSPVRAMKMIYAQSKSLLGE